MQSIVAPAKRMIVDSLLTNFILSVFINRLTNSIKGLVAQLVTPCKVRRS